MAPPAPAALYLDTNWLEDPENIWQRRTPVELELALQVTDEKVIAKRQDQHHQQPAGQGFDHWRPRADVAGVQVVEIDIAQAVQPLGRLHWSSSSIRGRVWRTVSWKTLA